MNRREFAAATAMASVLAAASRDRVWGASQEPKFIVQSNFWQNLHHTLYYQAQVLETAYGAGSGRLAPIDRAAFADLQRAAARSEIWYQALAVYHDHYAHLNFLSDEVMVTADNEIATAVGERLPQTLPVPMKSALELAAPLYRETLWPMHHADCSAFIAQISAQIARQGRDFADPLARIYQTAWLRQPYVVDVVAYAQWEGSYSNNADHFVHIVMSTQDPQEQGMGRMDVLFHEASHSIADPHRGTIGSAITRAVQARGRPSPDQFWHAVIMYAPGKLAEQIARRSGDNYSMVWMSPGLFGRDWARYYQALEQNFLPYINGTGNLDSAVTRCVDQILSFGR